MIIVCFTWSRGSDADDTARDQGRHRHPDWGHQLYLQKKQGVKANWVGVDQAIDTGDLPADLTHSNPFDDMEVTGWAGWLTDGHWTYSTTKAGITSSGDQRFKRKFWSDRRLP